MSVEIVSMFTEYTSMQIHTHTHSKHYSFFGYFLELSLIGLPAEFTSNHTADYGNSINIYFDCISNVHSRS